jgi:hypothetical protein
MPLLEQAYRAHHGNIAFLGVDANDSTGAAMAFLNQVHVSYPAVSDAQGQTALSYGLLGLPTTVFVSARGTIVGRHIGELHAGSLEASLREAFHD